MNTTKPTSELILTILAERGQARVHDLAQAIGIGKVALHRQIKTLLSKGLIEKRGSAPLVFYVLSRSQTPSSKLPKLSESEKRIIESEFLHISPDGILMSGVEGFAKWIEIYAKNQDPNTLATEFTDRIEEISNLKTETGCIDATSKIVQTFPNSPIVKMLYADAFSMPTFGRTKLARLVTHAKNSPDPVLITQIIKIIEPLVKQIIMSENIDVVGFIPPTVPRPVQFVNELARGLALHTPQVDLVKVMSGDISIPQKSLSTTAERVTNARQSIFLRSPIGSQVRNILLIDDVVGSGASFHETALKLQTQSDNPLRIVAFALVGNLKGFDVVRQI